MNLLIRNSLAFNGGEFSTPVKDSGFRPDYRDYSLRPKVLLLSVGDIRHPARIYSLGLAKRH